MLFPGEGESWMVFHGWGKGNAGYGSGGKRMVHFHPMKDLIERNGPLL